MRPATSRPSDDEAMELVDNCDERGWAIGRLDKLEQADGADGGICSRASHLVVG